MFLAFPAAGWAQFTTSTSNGQITIDRYNGQDAYVTIPSTIDGLPVTRIGAWAFADCYVTSVVIPSTVISFGNGAFFSCYTLRSVCFQGNAPSDFGTQVFDPDPNATVYYLDGTQGWDTQLGGRPTQLLASPIYRFNFDANGGLSLLSYTGTSQNITIPDQINGLPIHQIGDQAFSGCSTLTNASIPTSITKIGDHAFSGCSGMASMSIPSSVNSIGEGAFQGCSNLSSVVILSSSLSNIGDAAFSQCSNLSGVFFKANAPAVSGTDIFLQDEQTTIYYLQGSTGFRPEFGDRPTELLSLSGFTFTFSESGEIVVLSYVGTGGEVTIPAQLKGLPITTLLDNAFSECTTLTGVTIPSSVTNIGGGVFFECSNLANVTILSSITSIGDYSFYGCSSLNSVTIPSSVTSIGNYSFYGCSSLASVTIPPTVISIGDEAFSGCVSFTSIIIPSRVTDIGSGAFSGCSGLTSVSIPASVTSLGGDVFGEIPGLTAISVNKANPAFSSVNGVLFDKHKTELIRCPESFSGGFTVPAGITSIDDSAFSGCTGLTSVTFPSSLTSIGDYAFDGCTGLGSVTIPPNVSYLPNNAFPGSVPLRVSLPKLTVHAPKMNQYTGHFDFAGLVSDKLGIDSVMVRINGGEPISVETDYVDDETSIFILSDLQLENGKNTLIVQAVDVLGNSCAPVKVDVTYTNRRPELAGVYTGLLVSGSAFPPSNNRSGFVTVAVTSAGFFTGKAYLGGFVFPIHGIIGNDGVAHFNPAGPTYLAPTSIGLVGKGKDAVDLGNFALTFDTLNFDDAFGAITDGNGETLASLDLAPTTTDVAYVPTELLENHGSYTVVFTPTAEAGAAPSASPRGYGYGWINIKANGVATLKGKLADGTAITAASPINWWNQYCFFAQLYGNGGSIGGRVDYDGVNPGIMLTGIDLLWIRPAQPGSPIYENGWTSGITVNLFGTEYAGPSKTNPNSIFPDLKATDEVNGNATLTFSNGKLTSPGSVLEKSVNITTANKVSNIPLSNKEFILRLTPKSGFLGGSFTHTDNTTPAFMGVILQHDIDVGDSHLRAGGYGFFLSSPPKGTGGTVESGGVELLAK